MKYGYERCSTEKQDLIRQDFVLQSYELDEIFCEFISGTKKASNRPEFEKMLAKLQKGDTIYFESMSRMARSMQDLIDTTNLLTNKKGCTVIFLKENITVGGNGMDAMNSLIFNIMGAFAQFERDLIADRTKQALQAKKKAGVRLGKPTTYGVDIYPKIIELRNQGLSYQAIANKMGMAKSSVAQICKREMQSI